MKILFVDLDNEWRGGQSQALLTMRGLRELGHTAELVSPVMSALSQRAKALGFTIHETSQQSPRFTSVFLIKKLLKSSYDLLHANEPHALTAAWLARSHAHVPLIVSRRVANKIAPNWIARSRYLAASKVIAISEFVKKSLLDSGVPAANIALVYEGVEVPPQRSADAQRAAKQRWNLAEDDFVIGCVGYLLPEKGQEALVQAFREVAAAHANARLIFAGDGPCRETLEGIVASAGLTARVRFLGFVSDVDSVYHALDLFAFPSHAEPLGTSMLAAMARGLPVIGVAAGGVKEVVRHEMDGLLASSPNPAELAALMMRMINGKAEASQFGDSARKRIEDFFDFRRMSRNTVLVYEQARTRG